MVFFFKQKTAYEMRISDWSSDVCSSDLPFGVILTRLFGAGDLRRIGSGNIGATNVLRTGRKELAAATLILDGAKGAVAVLLARHFVPELDDHAAMIAGAAAMIGHCYPVWLKFRGGTGVATPLGLALAP